MEEIWKPIKNYEGYYEISNLGRVKSIARIIQQGEHTIRVKETIKSYYISNKGYPVVTLCKCRKSVGKYLHRLLAEAFIPNPDNKLFVDHINTDKLDYRLENLKWVTAKENSNNSLTISHITENANSQVGIAQRLLTRKQNKTKTGPKTIYQYNESGEFIKKFFSIAEAGRLLNVSPSYIRKILDTNIVLNGYFFTSA